MLIKQWVKQKSKENLATRARENSSLLRIGGDDRSFSFETDYVDF